MPIVNASLFTLSLWLEHPDGRNSPRYTLAVYYVR